MAKKTIEEILLAATSIKPKAKEKRQSLLKRVWEAVDEFNDDQWNELTEPAQNWANEAAKAIKADEEIPEFNGTIDNDADGEETEEKPAKKGKGTSKKAAAKDEDADEESEDVEAEEEEDAEIEGTGGDDSEEDEEKPAPKAKKGADKKPVTKSKSKAKDEEAEDEDEKPAPKAKKGAADKSKSKDDDEDEEKPAKKAKPDKKAEPKAGRAAPRADGVKYRIKKMLIKKPSMSADDIMEKLSAGGGEKPSRLTVASIRSEFRHSLHVLKAEGVLPEDYVI